jgi:small subunit ribosomal protein S1
VNEELTDPRESQPAETADQPTAEQPGEPSSSETADQAEPEPKSTQAVEAKAEKPAAREPAKPSAGQTAALYRSFRSHRPVEGRVERVIRGGFEVNVARARGFCPHSQMELGRIQEPEEYVGKKFLFRITQVRRGGSDVVISRRVLLEEERLEEAKAVRATLIEGSILQGRVAGLADFGVFVDLGAGVQGLVHLSEISHTRLESVEGSVKIGDRVDVKILKLDDKRGRISLSIRQAQPDPWQGIAERFVVKGVYPGSIQRLTDFGVFVELAPGLEALAPAGDFPPSKESWRATLEPNTTRDWMVVSVDPGQHRISLALPAENGDLFDISTMKAGDLITGKVQRIERFGVFIWLGPGCVGLIPNIWTGVQRGQRPQRNFPLAETVEVQVIEVADGGRKIRLAAKGVDTKKQAEVSMDSPRRSPAKPRRKKEGAAEEGPATIASSSNDGSFGTSLADKLRAALGQPRG